MTWNVRKCESGVDCIVDELRRLDADVICLQELTEPRGLFGGSNQASEIASALGMRVYSHGAPLDDRRNQCVAILSHRALAGATPLRTPNGRRNYGVTAVMDWNGTRLRVVSVHLAGTYMLDWAHIRRSFRERGEEWTDLLTRAAGRPRTVVAGDFNTGADPARLRLNQLGWRIGAPPGPTYPTASPSLSLDFGLCSPDLAMGGLSAVRTSISDHLPVVMELRRVEDPLDNGL